MAPGAAVAISVTGLSKSFGGTLALDSLALSVRAGEVRALLGQNGSGKSTLIKSLSGYHVPDEGTIEFAGRRLDRSSTAQDLGARFVHQDLGLVETESIVDNLALYGGYPTRFGTIRAKAVRTQAVTAMESVGLADLALNAPVGALSPAEKTGVAVARALMSPAGDDSPVVCLVLDEPTATLAEKEVDNLLQMVRRVADSGIAVLYVTHYLEEVVRVADSVTILRDGRGVYTENMEGVTRADMVRELIGGNFEEQMGRSDLPTGRAVGPAVLELRDVDAELLDGVNLQVGEGEIVGVAGLIGSGREKVCAAAFGALETSAGAILLRGAPVSHHTPTSAVAGGVMYLPSDRKRLGASLDQTARENFGILKLRRYWKGLSLSIRREESDAGRWFDELEVRPSGGARKPFRTFSGGNQQKILFAKWLSVGPAVMLLDEPTQGVDIGAKATLHKHIRMAADRGCGVLVNSSDHEELAVLCDRVLIFASGRVTSELTGAEISATAITHHCLQAEAVAA